MGLIEQIVAFMAILGSGQMQMATVFGSSSWDAGNPHSRLACYHREIDDERDFVVAHNRMPCRTKVFLYNPRTGRSVVARVGDRGPRHADIDLSLPVARQLRHNGREWVVVVPLPTPADPAAKARSRVALGRTGHKARRGVQAPAAAQLSDRAGGGSELGPTRSSLR